MKQRVYNIEDMLNEEEASAATHQHYIEVIKPALERQRRAVEAENQRLRPWLHKVLRNGIQLTLNFK